MTESVEQEENYADSKTDFNELFISCQRQTKCTENKLNADLSLVHYILKSQQQQK